MSEFRIQNQDSGSEFPAITKVDHKTRKFLWEDLNTLIQHACGLATAALSASQTELNSEFWLLTPEFYFVKQQMMF